MSARNTPDTDGVWRCNAHSTSAEARELRAHNRAMCRVKGGRKSKAQKEAERFQEDNGFAPPKIIEVPRQADILTDDGWTDAINEAYAAVRDRVRMGDASAITSAVQLLRAAQSEIQRRSETGADDDRLEQALRAMGRK